MLAPRPIALYLRSIASARGAEQAAAALARGLLAAGHRVDFLVEERSGWLLEDVAACGARVVELESSFPVRRFAQLRSLLDAVAHSSRADLHADAAVGMLARVLVRDDPPIAALVRYVRSERPRGVISFLTYPNLVLALAARRARGETVFIGSVQNQISRAAQQGSRWIRSMPALMRRFSVDLDAVAAASHGVACDVRAITGLPERRIRAIYNPIYEDRLEHRQAEPISHPWFGDPEIPLLLAAGKLKPQKDFPTLLRAFARVVGKRPARLVILGDGKERENLSALAHELGLSECVEFHGVVRNPFPYYAAASLFVLSSAWEGFGNVLVEALACGCPVVSTDCPSGPAEILEGGRFGRLVPVGDADALAEALLATLDAPRTSREVAIARAREFSVERAVAGYLALIREAGGRNGR